MENLSLQDLPPAGGPNHVQPPPGGPPQLPPQELAWLTEASTVRTSTEKLVLVLRDGRKLIGVLRSWDQFANLVLQDTIERTFVQDVYSDIVRGIYLVRGENVLLLGEIDLDKDDYIPEQFRKVSAEEAHAMKVKEAKEKQHTDKAKAKKLHSLGFEVEHTGEILF
ncbi:hypothetical protein OEA41_006336 [Lepraria neglecta]|uniref:U6 snRNA-associated Sm-like protein LSm1 n=1 Tax=Lepraria neglecta TaxID=209136 RepID=A0AAE0DMY7_9LECA|nr:hypothetical protein OEA41_006336 [Lepraria neglecta]